MNPFRKKAKPEEAPDTLAHLYLNAPGSTSWANLGYWKDTEDYPTACKTLAVLLGKKAELDSSRRVLDLGYGCGDQFFVWRDEFSLDLTRLCGINPSSVQTEFAKRKLSERTQDGIPTLIRSSLELGLDSLPDRSFDRILCLDSAYFFSDRKRFLQDAARILRPGGKIVSAELILREERLGPIDSWIRNAVCESASIPAANRVTPESLHRLLKETGFVAQEFEFLEEHVFAGFSRFLKTKTQKRNRAQSETPPHIAQRYRRFGEFLGGERMKRYFRFVLYSAELSETEFSTQRFTSKEVETPASKRGIPYLAYEPQNQTFRPFPS
ncbi:class I SAM-dependent methyltransferase [Leptospira gomenensis]|uniref:Class I SAM-dependent methyltransferase n=1 Tax=Leptospira gomenensis TaxID=2484974 RepID=A0A5F1YF11_9LEPT|nr:class I SAM-dependent methyltransferase [Leptospira gomenensis]TGK38260.1 class I SAM-dependent methyltransferase [Leptospira gomenensis]TGK46001.1 class I SAM-dependent methyltransferase [Leptospira gomenensis]TGK65265.1 class I SAM-dependent methyltransferase [Leptospira gomenensis]